MQHSPNAYAATHRPTVPPAACCACMGQGSRAGLRLHLGVNEVHDSLGVSLRRGVRPLRAGREVLALVSHLNMRRSAAQLVSTDDNCIASAPCLLGQSRHVEPGAETDCAAPASRMP